MRWDRTSAAQCSTAASGRGELLDELRLGDQHALDLGRVDRLVGGVDARLLGVLDAPEDDRGPGRDLLQRRDEGDGCSAADRLDVVCFTTLVNEPTTALALLVVIALAVIVDLVWKGVRSRRKVGEAGGYQG